MELPTDGQEFAHILFKDLPTGATVEASTDNRTTWYPTSPGATALERLALLRGPTCTRTDGHLIPTDTDLWIRVLDLPEEVVRRAGRVYLIGNPN